MAWGAENSDFGTVCEFREKSAICENEGRCEDWAEALPWRLQLVSSLLREKNNRCSRWGPYIDILPSEFPELPIRWTDTELSTFDNLLQTYTSLNVTQHVQKYKIWRDKAVTAYFNAQNIVPDETDSELVMWALDIVQTRSCRVQLPSGRPLRLLIPMYDMINHGIVDSVFYLNPHDAVISVWYETHHVSAGEQVFLNYGERSQLQMMIGYGFVPNLSSFEPVQVSAEHLRSGLVHHSLRKENTEFSVTSLGPSPSLINFFRENLRLSSGATRFVPGFEDTLVLNFQARRHALLVVCEAIVQTQDHLRKAREIAVTSPTHMSHLNSKASLVQQLFRSRLRTLALCACIIAQDMTRSNLSPQGSNV